MFDSRRVNLYLIFEVSEDCCKEAMSSLNVIRIKNAAFYAYHGAFENEQSLGGKFEFDVDMYCDLSAAAESDSLAKTIDYEQVYAFIHKTVLVKKYFLLEALANTIGRGLLAEFSALQKVVVKVRKPHPPVKGVIDYVEVEISQER